MDDIRFALRQLRKTPGFTAVALLTLAIGIGSCTAIFSVVNRVLLRPLDFPLPEQLVRLNESDPPDLPMFSTSIGDYATWRKQATSFQDMAAIIYNYVNITGRGDPLRVDELQVTANYLSTLGAKPMLGRDFLPGEDAVGKGDVALIGEGFWAQQFGRSPDILGQVIRVDGNPTTIIGVMPYSFHGPSLMVPTQFTPGNIANHGSHYISVTARMKPGVTLEQAHSELALISAQMAKDFPDTNKGWTVIARSLLDAQVGGIRKQLYALLAAVGFLLFIGCANVANLLLVRASARSREIAIRSAVGASRSRVIRQLVVEHIVLALLGGVLGTLAAYWGLHLLLTLVPNGIPRSDNIQIDTTVLAFSLGLSVLTGIGFGVVPAFQASRVDLNTVLKDAGRGAGEGRHSHRVRNALVVAELTIAVILLVGSGLLMRSFARLTAVNPGFDTNSAYTVDAMLPYKKYANDALQSAFAAQATEKMAQIPGVTAAAASQALPFSGDEVESVAVDGRHVDPADQPNSNYYAVTPGYFRAMGIPLIRGRLFTDADSAKAGLVAVVSQSFAKRIFPGADPIGKRISIKNATGVWSEIVGVVGDVKQYGLDTDTPAEAYEPFSQHPSTYLYFVLRTSGVPTGLSASLRSAVAAVDPEQPTDKLRPLADLVKQSVSGQRFAMTLLMVFSVVALFLATLGIHGVMASTVAQRTSEIGVRMALGAQQRDVLRMVALQGARLIAIGLAGGIVGALLLSRLISSLLFGIGATDPLTLAAACLLLGLAAFAACMLSAFRATRIDPITALRGT